MSYLLKFRRPLKVRLQGVNAVINEPLQWALTEQMCNLGNGARMLGYGAALRAHGASMLCGDGSKHKSQLLNTSFLGRVFIFPVVVG